MAKKGNAQLIRLQSAESPYYYVTTRSFKGPKGTNKMELKKYDPNLRRHVVFRESKMPNPKAS